MKWLVISPDYPSHDRNTFPFVKQLIEALADRGNECVVIAANNTSHYKRVKKEEIQTTNRGHLIRIIRPNYISVSKLHIGKFWFSFWLRRKAVEKCCKRLDYKPDVVYCHFWDSGLDGYKYAYKNNIPLFIASGESRIESFFINNDKLQPFYNFVRGVICVSTKNKEESIRMGLATENKCTVIPNAINSSLFRNHEQVLCRQKCGIPQNVFLVAFVGSFVERKGPLRLVEAIKKCNDKDIAAVFIGGGQQNPEADFIIFKGKVPHEMIPYYLGSADVFVLPTLLEGCCNAIIEAMACGLPVISSNLSFNKDVLDESNSILVDPQNIDEISKAISLIKNNIEFRKNLSQNALETSKNLDIEKRAEKIEDFIKSRI